VNDIFRTKEKDMENTRCQETVNVVEEGEVEMRNGELAYAVSRTEVTLSVPGPHEWWCSKSSRQLLRINSCTILSAANYRLYKQLELRLGR
jgi:hypothetical protein